MRESEKLNAWSSFMKAANRIHDHVYQMAYDRDARVSSIVVMTIHDSFTRFTGDKEDWMIPFFSYIRQYRSVYVGPGSGKRELQAPEDSIVGKDLPPLFSELSMTEFFRVMKLVISAIDYARLNIGATTVIVFHRKLGTNWDGFLCARSSLDDEDPESGAVLDEYIAEHLSEKKE